MMDIIVAFGGQPVEILAKNIEKSGVRSSDIRYALERQKTRILERTARGVDINEAAFKPYSEKGPFYYYPGRLSKNRRAAAGRVAKKTGGARTRVGVKYKSYGDFKRSLGRSFVDLLGPSAPHMLQSILVKAGDTEGTIGIYGPEADRAEGHNTGAGHLPQREFFGASVKDEEMIGNDIETLLGARINEAIQ